MSVSSSLLSFYFCFLITSPFSFFFFFSSRRRHTRSLCDWSSDVCSSDLDGSGVATAASWTLGTAVRTDTARATASGLAGSPVIFTATATAGAAATMAASSRTSQPGTAAAGLKTPPMVLVKDANGNPVAGVAVTWSAAGADGTVATRLQTPHIVLVSDANGNPVAGVTVTWAAASGGGSVDPATSTTDANGHAQTFRTLGILIGTQTTTATATVAGKDTTVTFSINATAAGASQMTRAGGDGQTGTVGTTLPTQVSVRVTDQFNNPVAGVTVTWTPATGSGSVNPTTSTSNTSGIAATTWTLGPAAGTQTVQATGAGSPVTFTATATAGAATQLTISTAPSATAQSGVAFTPPPVLQLRDANGNAVSQAGTWVTAGFA